MDLRGVETVPSEAGTRGAWRSLRSSRPCTGDRGPSVPADVAKERASSTLMPSPPPTRRQAPPPSVGSGSLHTGRVRSRRSWESGRRQDQLGFWVRLPERRFPAALAVSMGRWARERLRCGEWDAWLRELCTCLPRAPLGLLERRLIQFLEWGGWRRLGTCDSQISCP